MNVHECIAVVDYGVKGKYTIPVVLIENPMTHGTMFASTNEAIVAVREWYKNLRTFAHEHDSRLWVRCVDVGTWELYINHRFYATITIQVYTENPDVESIARGRAIELYGKEWGEIRRLAASGDLYSDVAQRELKQLTAIADLRVRGGAGVQLARP